MTTREKIFVVLGLAFGILASGGAYVLFRAKPAAPGAASAPPASAPMGHSAPSAAGAESQAESVQLTGAEQKSIGVQLAPVALQSAATEIVAPGRVEEAETQLSTISARVAGRIDKLYLDFTGQPVRRGQPVASIYSPDLLTAAQEYQLARQSRAKLAEAAPEARAQADEIVVASKRRLELWGVSPQQIEQIAAGSSSIYITTYATTSGIVKERKVTEGQYVSEGEALFAVADLSRVWVLAGVYQGDLPALRVGAPAEITSDALPGATLQGKVSFIEPAVSGETRTATARIEVSNPGLRLRPGMYVRVRITSPQGKQILSIPRSAVLDTGTRKLVYVATGNGEFEAREVQLGESSGGLYPVLSGLKEGEQVVTRGAFMIDSQTRISGGMTGIFGGSKEYTKHDAAEQAAARLELTVEPSSPKGGETVRFAARLVDVAGTPVQGAVVTVTFLMPAMPAMGMGEMKETAQLAWDGAQYVGELRVPSAGPWSVTAIARQNGRVIAQQRSRVQAK